MLECSCRGSLRLCLPPAGDFQFRTRDRRRTCATPITGSSFFSRLVSYLRYLDSEPVGLLSASRCLLIPFWYSTVLLCLPPRNKTNTFPPCPPTLCTGTVSRLFSERGINAGEMKRHESSGCAGPASCPQGSGFGAWRISHAGHRKHNRHNEICR